MIAVDTNVLVYARREEMPLHARALDVLRGLAEGDAPWGLPVYCASEFVRVVTHSSLFDPPTTPDGAIAFVEALLESPAARLLVPGPRYWSVFSRLVVDGAVRGNLVFDAQIAAVCIESGATEFLTEDRDFTRFPELTVRRIA